MGAVARTERKVQAAFAFALALSSVIGILSYRSLVRLGEDAARVAEGVVLPLDHWPLSRVLQGELQHGFEIRVRRLHQDWQLLDLKLPKVDGFVLTSSKEQRDQAESYRLGVNSYVVKPVSFDQLASAVQQLCLYWLLLNEAPAAET